MTDLPEKLPSPSPNVAETAKATPGEHGFGNAGKQNNREQTAEDEAAEQLGDFA
jgi:hypothetical protein